MNDHVSRPDLKLFETIDHTRLDQPPRLDEPIRLDSGAPADVPATDTIRKPGRPWLKRGLLGVAALAVLGGGAYYGWDYWTVGRFQVSTDDAYVKSDSTILAPKVSGYLKEVLVTDNQSVTMNQPLATIDDRDYVVALSQAHANVDAANAVVAEFRASIDQQATLIDQARATVLLDQANLTFAEQENARYAALAKNGAGSIQNAQQTVSKLAIAKATLQRDEAAVAAAEKQVTSLEAQLAKAQADLEHARSLQDQAELNVSYTTIAAPIDGVVGNRTLRVGQFVQAGTALMSVVPLSSVYIVANFKETQLTDIRPGQPVAIDVDSYPAHVLKGIVDSVAPASGQEFALLPPDNATGNFTKIVQRVPVKIRVEAGSPLAGMLRPGMSVVPTIDIQDPAGKTAH